MDVRYKTKPMGEILGIPMNGSDPEGVIGLANIIYSSSSRAKDVYGPAWRGKEDRGMVEGLNRKFLFDSV